MRVGKTEEEPPSPQHFKEDFKSRTWSLPSTTLGALPKAPEGGCLSRRKVARFAGHQWGDPDCTFPDYDWGSSSGP